MTRGSGSQHWWRIGKADFKMQRPQAPLLEILTCFCSKGKREAVESFKKWYLCVCARVCAHECMFVCVHVRVRTHAAHYVDNRLKLDQLKEH